MHKVSNYQVSLRACPRQQMKPQSKIKYISMVSAASIAIKHFFFNHMTFKLVHKAGLRNKFQLV